jgi:hypothetical protein
MSFYLVKSNGNPVTFNDCENQNNSVKWRDLNAVFYYRESDFQTPYFGIEKDAENIATQLPFNCKVLQTATSQIKSSNLRLNCAGDFPQINVLLSKNTPFVTREQMAKLLEIWKSWNPKDESGNRALSYLQFRRRFRWAGFGNDFYLWGSPCDSSTIQLGIEIDGYCHS